MTSPIKTAIIIPFFQRSEGLLSRCVQSILDQADIDGVMLDIIIADDSSPLPPGADLMTVTVNLPHQVRVVRQANGGAPAARNFGLDQVTADTDFVAFLDSDDYWLSGHLACALEALDGDHDFFFCDSENSPGETEFQQIVRRNKSDRITRYLTGRGGTIGILDRETAAYDMTLDYLSHTSSVVYRWARMKNLRFDRTLKFGGEDHLMWVQIAHRSRSVCFSTAANSIRGVGIDLYRSASDRLSGKNILKEASRARAFEMIAREPGLTAGTRHLAQARARDQWQEIAAIMLHPRGLKAATASDIRPALAQFDHGFWRHLPSRWAHIFAQKLLSRVLPRARWSMSSPIHS
jgi:succinoglycan biosynthesis protein ExoW